MTLLSLLLAYYGNPIRAYGIRRVCTSETNEFVLSPFNRHNQKTKIPIEIFRKLAD